MKTKEFIEKVKRLGFRLVEDGVGVAVYDKEMTYELASVSDMHEKRFELDLDVVDLTESEQESLMKLVVEYGATPLSKREVERKYEKRWHIHLSRGGSEYLNQDKETGFYELDTKYEINDYKTKFTRSEIGEWAGTSSDRIIDWIIDKFGEEVKR